MTPEAKVKRKVVEVLKKHGAYYFYPVTGGYGKSGVPDIVACFKGRFIGIECKAGSNTPTMLQNRNIAEIITCGGIAFVVNDANVHTVDSLFESLTSLHVHKTE